MRKTILYLAHCFYNRAGVEQHLRDLRAGLADDFRVFILFPHEGQIFLVDPESKPVSGPYPPAKQYPGEAPHWPVTPERQEIILSSVRRVLDEVRPDLIHVQHFHNLPLAVLDSMTSVGVPALISYHDYYPITPYFTMQGTNDPLACFSAEYALRTFRADISPYLTKRRDYLTQALARFNLHITPSPYLASVLSKVFPINCRVIEHGIAPFEPRPKAPSSILRFGCVGSLLPQKGWESLARAFAGLRLPPEEVQLHFYGGMRQANIPGLFFHGAYEQSDLPRICSEIDVAIIPSVFAETFSLVLSEMWMGGVPTAVSDIGAMGPRVTDGVNGKRFIPGDVNSIQATLRWFMEHDEWRRWQIPAPRTLEAMLTEYRKLYLSLLAR